MGVRRLFGKNLSRIRAELDLSQLQLSIKTGLTHNFINDIENGKKWLSDKSLRKFAKALKVMPYAFFMPIADSDEISGADTDAYLFEFPRFLLKMAADLERRYGV
jgi:transcriptional regulator with XRE-family HTH domain